MARSAMVAPLVREQLPRFLEASRLFMGLDPGLLSTIAKSASIQALVRTEHVWRAGDPANRFCLVRAGILKVVRRMPDGTESILGLFGPRDSIGDVAVLGRRPFPADAVVGTENAEVVLIPAEPILSAMATRPEVAARLNQTLIRHAELLQTKIEVMSAGLVERRLATLMLSLAERFGDELEDGTVRIPLGLSRAELGCLVCTRVETAIRTMRQWERSRLVDTDATGFVIHDVAGLEHATRGHGER